MTLIRPSPIENLYTTLFQLEPDRPYYYMFVVRLSKSILISLANINEDNQKYFTEIIDEMDEMIRKEIEVPLMSSFISVCYAYEISKLRHSKKAYVKVGDSIDYIEITHWEIQMALERVKDWILDKVSQLSPYIRFTRPQQMLA